MSATRVAIIFEQLDTQWLGGLNYFSNLIRSVKEMPNSKIQVVIFAGKNVNLYGMDAFAEVVRSGYLDKNTLLRTFRKTIQIIIKKDIFLYFLLKRYKIKCLSHFGSLWIGCPIPSLTWIADLQHKRLPQFFDAKEIKRRNNLHLGLLHRNCNILLSSQSAANDFIKYYPENKAEVNILRFAAGAPESWTPQSKKELVEKYNLNQNWFHIPNQFWAHKNHHVVIDAIKLLKKEGVDFQVISTGNTAHMRDSAYFNTLSEFIEINNLKNYFRVLGAVPYDDVLSLMYHSLAVVNPSLFEGWSTTVEEAKSMGKTVILSNIDVHIEQSPKRKYFFDPHDSLNLARIMKMIAIKYDPQIESIEFNCAKAEMTLRQQKFGQNYENVILKMVKKSNINYKLI